MWKALSKDNRIAIFYGGLLLLLILLAAFFLLENTLIHRNRRAERTYLSIVVMFAFGWIMTTTVLLSDLTGEPSEEYTAMIDKHPIVQYLPAAMEFTVITLLATRSLLGLTGYKVRKFTGSWPLDERHIYGSYSAKRAVEEIEQLQERINKHTTFELFNHAPAFVWPLCAILYFFFKTAASNTVIVAYLAMVIIATFLIATTVVFLKNLTSGFLGHQVVLRNRQEEIFLAALSSEDSDELNYVVQQTRLASILAEAPLTLIHLFSSPQALQHRLNTASKAVLVDALMKRGARGTQQEIAEIIFSAKSTKLTKLKNIIDTGGDYHNLMKLISDITNSTLKAEVIAHIKREAREALKENQGKALGIKTLSDVDDTLYCSGGKFPAGVDKRLPRRCLYPGVFKFLECIDTKVQEDGSEYLTVEVHPVSKSGKTQARYSEENIGEEEEQEGGGKAKEEFVPSSMSVLRLRRKMDREDHVVACKRTFVLKDPSTCNLVFLSARPHLYKEVTEQKSYRRFRHYVSGGTLHRMPTLLPGKLWPGTKAFLLTPFIKTQAWKWVGEIKFKSFCDYTELYMEYDFVFVGDNGQGDLYAAEKMLEVEWLKDRLKGVFIHQVLEQGKQLDGESVAKRLSMAGAFEVRELGGGGRKKPCIFNTYVDAAVSAYKMGMFNKDDMHQVACSAIEDFDDLRALHPEFEFEAVGRQLAAGLVNVNREAGEGYRRLFVEKVERLATMHSLVRGASGRSGRGSGGGNRGVGSGSSAGELRADLLMNVV